MMFPCCPHDPIFCPMSFPGFSHVLPMLFPDFSIVSPTKNIPRCPFWIFSMFSFPTSQNLHIFPMKTVASGAARQHEIHQAAHAETTRRHHVGQTSPVSFSCFRPLGFHQTWGVDSGRPAKMRWSSWWKQKRYIKSCRKYETYGLEQQKLGGIWLGYHRICWVI